MEKAVWVANIAEFDTNSCDSFDYLYIGSELCPGRFPANEKIKQAARRCEKEMKTLVVVTPLLTMASERNIRETLRVVHGFVKEIVVNDWGTLLYLRDIGYTGRVHIGRILGRGKTDPRVNLIKHSLPAEISEYYQKPPWHPQFPATLKNEFPMVWGVEFDCPLHGFSINRAHPGIDFPHILHTPYVYIAGSRWCPFLDSIHPGFFAASYNGPCSHGCEKGYGILTNPEFGEHELLLFGSSLMVRNDNPVFSHVQPQRMIDNSFYYGGKS